MAKKKFNSSTTVNNVTSSSVNQVPVGSQLQNTVKENIKILYELEYFIRKLHSSEYQLLSDSIRENGCKEPIKLWRRENDFVIIDGHHRFQICQELGIDFKTEALDFHSIDEVKMYMAKLQLGRRNLTLQEMSFLRGMQYAFNKKGIGQNTKQEGNTRDVLAKEYGVSSATISRDYWIYLALEKLSSDEKQLFLEGDSFLQKQDLEFIAKNEIDINQFLKHRKHGKSIQDFQKDVFIDKKNTENKHYFSSFSSRLMSDFKKASVEERLKYKEQLLELIKTLDQL